MSAEYIYRVVVDRWADGSRPPSAKRRYFTRDGVARAVDKLRSQGAEVHTERAKVARWEWR